MPRIAALLVYPLESCRGVRVKQATASPLGLEGDRRWRVTDEVGAPVGASLLGGVYVQQLGTDVVLTAAGMERLTLPAGMAAAEAWFTKLLGKPAKCVERPVTEAEPFLATTTTSLVRLNQALPEALQIERFSSNIVLEGTTAFEEDEWTLVRMGGARFFANRPAGTRLPFGVELRLEDGGKPVQLRAGQTLDVFKT